MSDALPPLSADDLAHAREALGVPPGGGCDHGRRDLPCRDCGLPYAYIQAGALVIESRHKGRTHRNRITLATVRSLLEAAR